MNTYQVFWAFPNQEASVKCTPAFVQYLTEGKQGDKFEGFEIKYRVLDPQNETGNLLWRLKVHKRFGNILLHGLKDLE